MGIFACYLCAGIRCIAAGGTPAPAKNCFLVCYSTVGLVKASPVGSYSQVTCRPIPYLATAKAGVPDICTISSQGDTGLGFIIGTGWKEKAGEVFISFFSLWGRL